MDAISQTRLAAVNPDLASRAVQMITILEAGGIAIRVTEGLRSWARQSELWQMGRDFFGVIVDPTKVVTNAKPGYGWHEYGCAVDVVPDDLSKAGFQPDWNETHEVWKRLIAVGDSTGLQHINLKTRIGKSRDWPHFQHVGRFGSTPNDEVRSIFANGGMAAVWDAMKENPTVGWEVLIT